MQIKYNCINKWYYVSAILETGHRQKNLMTNFAEICEMSSLTFLNCRGGRLFTTNAFSTSNQLNIKLRNEIQKIKRMKSIHVVRPMYFNKPNNVFHIYQTVDINAKTKVPSNRVLLKGEFC